MADAAEAPSFRAQLNQEERDEANDNQVAD